MLDPHAPDDEFVERLERLIAGEVRRRNRFPEAPRWTTWSRMKAAVAAAGLMLLSMGIGAAVTSAAYRAQGDEQRDLLTAAFERRVELARQRLVLVSDELEGTERNVSVGIANREGLFDGRVKVAEAQAQLKSLELQLEEVRFTGREPLSELSAPLASGRDFVGDRLRIDMTVTVTALEVERSRLHAAESRLEVGMASPIDVEVSRVRTLEVEAALEAVRRKIEIRRKFLSGQMDTAETELRGLEGEAEQRQKTLGPEVALATKQLASTQSSFEIGRAQSVDVARAKLRLQELQTEMARAELDLQLVRRRIEQHRLGR